MAELQQMVVAGNGAAGRVVDLREYNTVRRIERTGGWRGVKRTLKADVESELRKLNDGGYRVAFVIPDSWNIWQWIKALFITICTLGFKAPSKGFLVIGEKVG